MLKPRAPTLPAGQKLTLGPRSGFPDVFLGGANGGPVGLAQGVRWLSGSRKKHMSCLFGASFVTGHTSSSHPPFPALLLDLFSPPPCHSEVRVSATHTHAAALAYTDRQTHTDCNSMVECIIDGSALKDPLLIL